MGRLQKVARWFRKWFGKKKPKEDDCRTAVLEDNSDGCHTGRSPPVVAADVTGPASSSDDVTVPASFSDDVTVPALFTILLASSFHMREVVFSECTVLDLARLSGASRAAREMSLSQMARRKLDVKVVMRRRRIPNATVETTVLKIRDCYGPTVTRKGPTVRGDQDRTKHHKFCTIIYPLLAFSRIRLLDIQQENGASCVMTEMFLKSGLIGFHMKPFYVESMRVPCGKYSMPLLQFILANRVVVTGCQDPDGNCPTDSYTFRAMLEADYVELATVDDEQNYYELVAPNIVINVCWGMENLNLAKMIRQWQFGHRIIVTLSTIVGLEFDYDLYRAHGIDAYVEFDRTMRESTADFTEIPYPSDDVIPASVRLQLEKAENYYKTTDKKPRAFEIGRNRDDVRLLLLARTVEKYDVAVGVFLKH